ncbi:hypothetical protein [Lentzea sp. NPDC060358]|uniref:hypothetical protein n=1 Tax=Lentzea sp. NPDC060358 TaxID=3347103 RepID=UPI00364859A3
MATGPERSRRAARAAAGDPRRYRAVLDQVHADFLCGLDEPDGVTRGPGAGEVVLTAAAVAYLQELPPGWDCHVDRGARWIHVEGAPHPPTPL